MVKPIPDGYPRVTPYLYVDGAKAAIDFYASVLGAQQRLMMPGPDGKVGHAELSIGDSVIMLADEFPDMDVRGPKSIGGSPITCTSMSRTWTPRSSAPSSAGATVRRPVEDKFYGDRSGEFEDPFGHRWNVSTHVEDLSPEEMQERMGQMPG